MKIKIEYKKALREESEYLKKNDKLRYEIERFKRMELIERSAEEMGMRELNPGDFAAIIIKERK